MRKLLLGLFIALAAFVHAGAQTSVTIPSQTYTANFTINGQTGTLTIVQPAQVITVPSGGGTTTSYPGLSVSGTTLTFAGSIVATGSVTGTQISLTGGPTLPASGNNLYVLQASGTPTVLAPVPLAIPVITFSQASTPANSFNLTATP